MDHHQLGRSRCSTAPMAERTMTPSIVVMHASDVDPPAATRRGHQNLRQLERILVDELVPLIKQRYTVRTDADSWAIAGVAPWRVRGVCGPSAS